MTRQAAATYYLPGSFNGYSHLVKTRRGNWQPFDPKTEQVIAMNQPEKAGTK